MIVVFGSINADLVARVEHLPHEGETQFALAYTVHAGGKGANQALAARCAGADVALVGAVGRDGHAAVALAALAAAGVSLDGVARVDAPTGIALIHVDATGRNTITVVPGANACAQAATVSEATLVPGATLLLQLEVPLAEISALTTRARLRGVRTILNAAPAHALPAALLAAIDVLIVNEHEAAALAAPLRLAGTPREFARALSARNGGTIIVTLGANGAVACAGGEMLHAPAPTVTVVDTTGAGDAFAGAFAAALDRGYPLRGALARGVAGGTLACAREGAQASLPDAGMIDPVAQQVESSITINQH